MKYADLLIEIGTEELPTRAVETLSEAFAQNMLALLDKAQITYQAHFVFATPRRIALLVKQVAELTPALTMEHRGPPLTAAFKADGTPTAAAVGFAHKFNVPVNALEKLDTDKGSYLIYQQTLAPVATLTLLLDFIERALATLPIKKPMAWGSNTFKFVRPVHWVLVLFGDQVPEGQLFNQTVGRATMGHRFLNNHPITIDHAEHYPKILFEQGSVVAHFATRKNLIQEKIKALAEKNQLHAVIDAALLDEVTCLVEWPEALLGRFDKKFLSLPPEVISCALKQHQKIFVLVDAQQQLQPFFITIANIKSTDPQQVIAGNEKVVQARLSDAAFFFAQDKKHSLTQNVNHLAQVVFQQDLGSLLDKSQRISALAQHIATQLGLDPALMAQAGLLCKADLISAMVSEFPELQGIMGAYYAQYEQQDPLIINAIREHYQPQGASEAIPTTVAGAILAIADKLDTVCGIFALGKKPTGDKDPFALKRAMIGVLRILIGKALALDLNALLHFALTQQPLKTNTEQVLSEILNFTWDRWAAYLREKNIPPELLTCVTAIKCYTPYDMHQRIQALNNFIHTPAAVSLATAHKRIHNLLAQQNLVQNLSFNSERLCLPPEKQLGHDLLQQKNAVSRLCQQGQYVAALNALAQLKPALDTFFAEVLVMDLDLSLRANRLALLKELDSLFLHVADLSYLPVTP